MISVRVTRDAIDAPGVVRLVASQECGAVSLFLGMVRDRNEGREVSGIEYSAYETMAELEMRRIVEEAASRYFVHRIAVEHRLGILALGDISVAIAVADEHRAPALDAGRYVIEEVKRRVPIWKREHYTDGTREWIDPTRHHEGVSP